MYTQLGQLDPKKVKVFVLLCTFKSWKTDSKVLELMSISDISLAVNMGHELTVFDIMEGN